MGSPYIHHYQYYLDISFQEKLKNKEGSGYFSVKARATAPQDRRRTGQAMELCDSGMSGKLVKAGSVPPGSISVSNIGGNHAAFHWRSLRINKWSFHTNPPQTKYPGSLISAARWGQTETEVHLYLSKPGISGRQDLPIGFLLAMLEI